MILIIYVLLGLWFLFEIVTVFEIGSCRFIKNNGFLNNELKHASLNPFNNKIIILSITADFRASYILKTGVSLIFPYIVYDKNNTGYPVLIFTRPCFLIKAKFKELNNKRFKF